MEAPGLTDSFTFKEQQIQSKKAGQGQGFTEVDQFGPESLEKQDGKQEDIVEEEKIDQKVQALKASVDKLPVPQEMKDGSDEDSENIYAIFQDLVDQRTKDVMSLEDAEGPLKETFARTMKDLDNFVEDHPEVKAIFETIAPLFALKDQIAQCKGDNKKITSLLQNNGINGQKLVAIQKRLGVAPDGQFGQKTQAALNKMLNLETTDDAV